MLNAHLLRSLRNRAGSSLVELAASLGVVAILTAASLPALLNARSQARRNFCQTRLKQVTHGALSYEYQLGRLPPIGLMDQATAPCPTSHSFRCFPIDQPRYGGPFASWIVLILPYMGEQLLYDEFDLTVSVYEQSANPQRSAPASLICPTANAQRLTLYDIEHSPFGGAPFGRGNYAAFVGPHHAEFQQLFPGALGGFEPGGPGQRLVDVPDGLSTTLAVTEVRAGQHAWDARGAWALPFPGSTLVTGDVHPIPGSKCYDPDPAFPFATTPNQTDEPVADTLFVCRFPQIMRARRMPCTRAASYLVAAPRSFHPGGVHATRLDESCMFLTDNIDPAVYGRLIHTRDKDCNTATPQSDKRWQQHRKRHPYE